MTIILKQFLCFEEMRSYMYNILRYPEQVADGETGKLRSCGHSSSNDQKSRWAPTHLKKKKKTAQKRLICLLLIFTANQKQGIQMLLEVAISLVNNLSQ